MKAFHCDSCRSLVFFESVKCVKCGHTLGFLPSEQTLSALEPAGNGALRALAPGQQGQLYRLCENSVKHEVCNWLIPVDDANPFCVSCRLNHLIPNVSVAGNLDRWHKLEIAKRRNIYTMLRLGLPIDGVPQENRPALAFDFVADTEGALTYLTGYLNGLITINIAEADEVERERRRINLHEPFRTLLGHIRHEMAHYYWDRLISGSEWLPGFRKLFGDESADYGAALQQYYETGAPADWQTRHVSAYGSAHPSEDWAEAWAHYFHIIDMVETAGSFGIILQPDHPSAQTMTARPQDAIDPRTDFGTILENWFPLTHALNAINRGMGLADAYPFVLSNQAIEKLEFIHQIVQAHLKR